MITLNLTKLKLDLNLNVRFKKYKNNKIYNFYQNMKIFNNKLIFFN